MYKKIALWLVVLGLLIAIIWSAASLVSAQSAGQITISNSQAQMDFPLSLNFSAKVTSNTRITDIRLRYQVEQMSYAEVTSEIFVTFSSSASVNARCSLDMRKIGGFPPGTWVDYWWLARDAGGASLETQPVRYQIQDNRYKWQNLTEGKINLHWYQGNANFAQALMETAQQSLTKLVNDTGVAPNKTIDIYIYAGSEDLQGSMIYPSEWTGGVAFTPYNIITIGINPSNLTWGKGAMTHELTHNVIYQVTFNPYNDLPVWLNEGLAMHSEGPLSSSFLSALKNAISSDRLISVRTLCSPFSAYSDKAYLSYAESETLVDYLIQMYGSAKMTELLHTFQQGSTYDEAFQKVYGLDMEGLNSQWQPWVKKQYGK